MSAIWERMPVEEQRRVYECPPWCVRWDHDADAVGSGEPPNHYGPDFGACGVQSNLDVWEAVVYLGGEASYSGDPTELRKVAANMLDAADWLEEHRPQASR